jgi:hypothetical protein
MHRGRAADIVDAATAAPAWLKQLPAARGAFDAGQFGVAEAWIRAGQ